MSPEAQRIAIAEACGWKIESYGPSKYPKLYWRLRRPDGTIHWDECTGEDWSRAVFTTMVPEYLGDLNAMNEAERVLPASERGQYVCWLVDVLKRQEWSEIPVGYEDAFYPATATASQRAEAFLRTLGLWDDTK